MTSTQQDEASTATSEPASVQCARPGELLRKAREARGLSQDEVAKQLNFLPVYIPALEQEDFSALHSKTFIKGYMRAYARFLKIDAEEVLNCLAAHHPELEKPEQVQPVEGVKPSGKGRSLIFKLFTILVVAALIGVIILWWQSRSLEPLPALTSQDVQVDTLNGETITAPLGQAEEERAQESLQQVRPLVAEAEPEVAAVEPEAPAEPVASEPRPQPAPAPTHFEGDPQEVTADNAQRLALTFSGDCWTEVRDSLDRVLHANLNREGSRVLLEGEPPFRIVLGQGRAAQVYHQGQAFDFTQRIRANGYASFVVE